MQDEEGDTGLAPRPQGSLSAAGNQAPCRHRHCLVALGAGWATLTLAAIVLSRVVSHLVSEKGQTPAAPGSDGAGSRDPSTAECSACLERFRSQLCHPALPSPAGGSGCKLCPTDWQLRGDKCYWVSRRGKMWNESRADCSARGSQLLVIRDREELESLQNLSHSPTLFWVGLSIPSPEKTWTWLDGSRLDQPQLLVSGPAEGNSCGVVKGNWIRSDPCSSAYQWICQRDAVLL